MLKVLKILVTAHALVGGAAMLAACGQKGPLVLPSTPESVGRATLPQTLKIWPASPVSTPPATEPAGPAAAPASAATTSPITAPEAPTVAPQ